jgi:acetylornithine deacetylase/succinyl-diaminopimelate desuccinylase-like protein
VADDQVSVATDGDAGKAPGSPMRPDILRAVNRITDSMWPGLPVIPNQVTGATDGRYLRAAGIPTYGIQGFALDRDDLRIHGKDERMPVKSFYEGQVFLYELVKILAGPQ